MKQGFVVCFGFVTMVAFYGAFISVAMSSSSVEQNVSVWCIDVVNLLKESNQGNLIKVSDEVTFLKMDLFWPILETLELPWVRRE